MASTVKDLRLRDPPSVVDDRVKTQTDILKFSKLAASILGDRANRVIDCRASET
jgi:hypothetical protein